VGRRYDSNQHLVNQADHTEPLAPEFVDRFAVVGPPERCVARLEELADLGLDRVVLTGATFGADRDEARMADRLLTGEVLPALRQGAI
jgi:5,10-methylenetetrahydromethanopterin reductase